MGGNNLGKERCTLSNNMVHHHVYEFPPLVELISFVEKERGERGL